MLLLILGGGLCTAVDVFRLKKKKKSSISSIKFEYIDRWPSGAEAEQDACALRPATPRCSCPGPGANKRDICWCCCSPIWISCSLRIFASYTCSGRRGTKPFRLQTV